MPFKCSPLLLAFSVALFFMTSCREPKELEYRDFKNLSSEKLGFSTSTFKVDLIYYNPNNFGLQLKRTDLDVYIDSMGGLGYPNTPIYMKYHDHNKCVRVSALDQWTMPALNALEFRTVYFADDSGETVNFRYLFKKIDDGSWMLDDFKARVQ